ncbi:immunity protein Tsi6 family protein [Vibrio vulnificus]|uniref:immunity protein Tsi6 family protein n=1 Tax=Vibrio vulnificus TaxID=672 RepID=UPI00209DB47C|nr:immunity protein Tsi6 family protein [Vibrio vulnificus]
MSFSGESGLRKAGLCGIHPLTQRYESMEVMTQENVKIDICNQAIETLKLNRSVLQPQLFDSIEKQLEWLISYFEGTSNERSKLFELTFGHYSTREIDPRERDLVDALNKAFYVAVQTRRGLKLELSELGIDS